MDLTKQLAARQQRLAAALPVFGLDALVLNPGPSLVYFTGLHLHLSERPSLAIFAPPAPVALVLPELEAGKSEVLPFAHHATLFGDDPQAWPAAYRQAAEFAGIAGRRTGVEARRLRVLELRLLEQSAPGAAFLPGEECLASRRMVKDDSEIAAMRRAVQIAQLALTAALKNFAAGMSEQDLAAELTVQLLRHGSQPELPFAPIVASGPNSANPHAFPTERRIQNGDLLVIDWGAVVDGYISDLTRTFVVGEAEPELARIAQVVREANAAGRAAAGPGVTAAAVDQAARRVIEQAGYGGYFTHRTGHGIGMEGHEEPYIRAGNNLVLAPGMTFTVEPGIYLPGRGGVRVEDNVVITPAGAETLSDLPRELISLG